MQHLREVLAAKLRQFCPDVYYSEVSSQQSGDSFIIYAFNWATSSDQEQGLLDIHCFARDIKKSEQMAVDIKRSFDGLHYKDDQIHFTLNFERMLQGRTDDNAFYVHDVVLYIRYHDKGRW